MRSAILGNDLKAYFEKQHGENQILVFSPKKRLEKYEVDFKNTVPG